MFALILSIIVLSYNPAPGQFINVLPAVADDPAVAAQSNLDRGSLVSLGAAGGSLTAQFSEPIINSHDYDITVYGNAFENGSEPGIIFLSYDENGNGLADDIWYEVAGSEYDQTVHKYTITYYRPTSDTSRIQYSDSEGNTGFIPRNTFHTQPYFPSWITEDVLTYQGALLPLNINDINGDGSLVHLEAFDYGYADNAPNSNLNACSIKIDWAVDSLGNPANLPQVDFIRIQTGVLYTNASNIGELSTEVSAIHPTATLTSTDDIPDSTIPEEFDAYTITGQFIGHYTIHDLPELKARLSILNCQLSILKGKSQTIKLMLK